MVRVLVTVEPRMYREAIALAMQRHRPDAEVMLVSAVGLDGQVDSFEPHMLVRNDSDEAIPEGLLESPHGARALEHGTDHHLGRLGEGAHRLQGLLGPLEGHLHLHDDHIRGELAGEPQGVFVVWDLGDDLQAPMGGEDPGESLAEHDVVVREQHPDRPLRVWGRVAVP